MKKNNEKGTITGFMSLMISIALSVSFGCKDNKNKTLARIGNELRPNIILIMADDMGYSDIGCYGGEISTPNIDSLAVEGVRFTQFYNNTRCCPTRASLMTGKYPHQSGMGWMTAADLGSEGYSGDLSPNTVVFPEILRDLGYSTYMSGKWHLTSEEKINSEYRDSWPTRRGFNEFFGTIKGAGDYYRPETLARNEEFIEPEDNFYYTDAISEEAVKYITEHTVRDKSNPFFLYVAYTAPHWPLQAKERIYQKYLKMYAKGWDSLRITRYSKMLEKGVVLPILRTEKSDTLVTPWIKVEEKERAIMIKRMAIYAAQIEIMDSGIGNIVESLRKYNQLDNTLVVFLSDNGAPKDRISRKNNSIEALGSTTSYESLRRPWAHLSNFPFSNYKISMYEGGISTPFILKWPARMSNNKVQTEQIGHVMDLAPTFIELAGGDPKAYHFQGRSLLTTFDNEVLPRGPIFWEHEVNRAVRHEKWKLVSNGEREYPYLGQWELYDLSSDRGETIDLAGVYPEKVIELGNLWEEWARTNYVLPLDGRGWNPRVNTK